MISFRVDGRVLNVSFEANFQKCVREYHVIQGVEQAGGVIVDVEVEGGIDQNQPIRFGKVPFNQQISKGSSEVASCRISYNDDFLHLTIVNLPEDEPEPHVGLEAVIESLGIGVLGSLSVVH